MLRYFTSEKIIPFLSGTIMTINFAIFWAIPVVGMGNLYKFWLKPYLHPLYLALEGNTLLRSFASKYIYLRPEHADFFALSYLLIINCSIAIPTVFYWQLKYGSLPGWLIFLYYCSWVGIGGSMMGAAYGLAHKEGHAKLYKPEIQKYIGNVFENTLGVFFGNVPWNFTTSHIKIHHGVNGGIGDTFYLWDFDRTSFGDFMLYVHRVLLHMVGYSSIKYFVHNGMKKQADLLQNGVITYVSFGIAILAVTRSLWFVFWIYLQPLMCMTYFLALINVGFHGFLEFDDKGNHIKVVNASTIVNGVDDLFGEDDHMTHHYNTTVYYRDLPEHQKTKIDEFTKYKASVFHTISIVELSIFILFSLWDELAKYYVDYSGKMTKEEIITMLKTRAKRKETTYEDYENYLIEPSIESRNKLRVLVNNKQE